MKVNSSNIADVSFKEGQLVVTFRNGSSYTYSGVDQQTYEAFINAESPGKFFFSNIKNAYTGNRQL